jgi:hypothetical protein
MSDGAITAEGRSALSGRSAVVLKELLKRSPDLRSSALDGPTKVTTKREDDIVTELQAIKAKLPSVPVATYGE